MRPAILRECKEMLEARVFSDEEEYHDVSSLFMRVAKGIGTATSFDIRISRSLPMHVLTVLALPSVIRTLTDTAVLKLTLMYISKWLNQCPKDNVGKFLKSVMAHILDNCIGDGKSFTYPKKFSRTDLEPALVKMNERYCMAVVSYFLEHYYTYNTGEVMTDAVIEKYANLTPYIQDIGYVAFGHFVMADIEKRHELMHAHTSENQYYMDNRMVASHMKHIADDIHRRVSFINDMLIKRKLMEVTYMDSCRVTCALLQSWLVKWVRSGFTSPYPTAYKLRTTDIDAQMVRFHRAVFCSSQFVHLNKDIYKVADKRLATSVVYFNFCSIGGKGNLIAFMDWYRNTLEHVKNTDMPMVSFSARGFSKDYVEIIKADGMLKRCSYRGMFMTYMPSSDFAKPKVAKPLFDSNENKNNGIVDLHCTIRQVRDRKARVMKEKAVRRRRLVGLDLEDDG